MNLKMLGFFLLTTLMCATSSATQNGEITPDGMSIMLCGQAIPFDQVHKTTFCSNIQRTRRRMIEDGVVALSDCQVDSSVLNSVDHVLIGKFNTEDGVRYEAMTFESYQLADYHSCTR